MSEAVRWLDRALDEWARGEHYEAHESLEEWAEELEDPDLPIGLALIHVAAAIHKHRHRVSPEGVPGKLAHALEVLSKAPPGWQGLDVQTFTHEVQEMADAIARGAAPIRLPLLRKLG